jgi:putative NADH-flavin reductase
MGLVLLTERHKDQIAGVLSCYDRVLVFGTLPTLCFAEGMTSYLYAHKVRIFDYPRFAEPYRNELRENAERLAAENGITIEQLRKKKYLAW